MAITFKENTVIATTETIHHYTEKKMKTTSENGAKI